MGVPERVAGARAGNPDLTRLRAEAAALLGLTDHPNRTGKEENAKQRSTP